MLRKRSRSRQALMAETGGSLLRSPIQKQSKATSFPKLFAAFGRFKTSAENDADASPTSILDGKPFSVLKNPFWSDNSKTDGSETRLKFDPKQIGLAIVVDDRKTEFGFSRPGSGTVLFGSQLRIQVPDSPRSPSDFGIKSKNSHMGSFSSGLSPPETNKSSSVSPRFFTGSLSAREMELSEYYTCVISHGPNPRTIHIFDNNIVAVGSENSAVFRGSDYMPGNGSGYNFPSSCFTCKKNLEHGKAIFVYRGERAFCSIECRSMEEDQDTK